MGEASHRSVQEFLHGDSLLPMLVLYATPVNPIPSERVCANVDVAQTVFCMGALVEMLDVELGQAV